MLSKIFAGLLVLGTAALAAEPADLPATEADAKKALVALIRRNRQQYGEDAAVMQGLFLMNTNQRDAVIASECAITGFEETDDRRYVAIRVASGAVFDDGTMNQDERLARVWHSILEPTFQRYETFDVNGDGIVVEVTYNHRPYRSMSELYETIDDVGPVERVKFYLTEANLAAYVENRLGAQDLLDRSRVLVDEKPVKMTVHEIVGPPRDE
jgi:hypothetical protein